MAKYCSQCGIKLSFKNSFTINKKRVCGACLIERLEFPKKVLPKYKVKPKDKGLKDEQVEKKQKSLGWVAITGCMVPSFLTGIIFSGYDLKGIMLFIAFVVYFLLLILLTGSIKWSIDKFMKSRKDFNLHKMHFASNIISIIAVIMTILLAIYLSQGNLIIQKITLYEKLIFAAIILIVAYFSYVAIFFINRYIFGRKQKKKN